MSNNIFSGDHSGDRVPRNKETVCFKPAFAAGYTLVSDVTKIPLIFCFDDVYQPGQSLFEIHERAEEEACEINSMGYACHVEPVPDIYKFFAWAFTYTDCDCLYVFGAGYKNQVGCKDIFGNAISPETESEIANQTIRHTAEYMQMFVAGIMDEYFESAAYDAVEGIIDEKFYVPLVENYPSSVMSEKKLSAILNYTRGVEQTFFGKTATVLPMYTDLYSFKKDYPTDVSYKLLSGKSLISQLPRNRDYIVINPSSICFVAEKKWLKGKMLEVLSFNGQMDSWANSNS